MAPGLLIYASTASDQPQMMFPQKSRPDSPGGYFTLSDSDGASATSAEIKPDQKVALYKLFRSPSIKSVADSSFSTSNTRRTTSEIVPKRPSFRQPLVRKTSTDLTPPRPPLPLSYASTLPPPVPKKTVKQWSSNSAPKRSELNSSNASFKSKPLQRIQPLQIQSPSVLRALTSTSVTPRTSTSSTSTGYMSSSEDNNQSSLESNISQKPILPVKKRPPPLRTMTNKKPRPSSEVTQTSFLKSFHQAKSSSTDSLSSNASLSASQRISQASSIQNKPCSPQRKSISLKAEDKSSQGKPLLKASSDLSKSSKSPLKFDTVKQIHRKGTSPDLTTVNKPPLPAKRIIGQLNSVQPNRQLIRSTSTGTARPSIDNPKTRSQVHRSNSTSTDSSKITPRRASVPQKSSSSTVLKPITKTNVVRRPSSSDISSSPSTKVISPQKKSSTKAFASTDKDQKLKRSVSQNRSNSATREIEKTVENVQNHLKNSICSLVKLYEMNPQNRHEEDNDISVQSRSERLQSWLSNPLPSLDSKDFSMMEVDILDQYVTQMLSFTRGALSGIESPQQTLIKTDKTSQCSSSLTLKDHYNQEQRDQPKQKHQSRTVTKSTDPSEEDLSRGVFTEVSFAGTFASSQKPTPIQKQERSKLDAPVSLPIDFEAPVPSPRLKRKARKEQMLKEHKETGREALSLLVKNFQSNKYEDGNALLDDLCHHGAEVEKDICEERKLFETMRKQTNKEHMRTDPHKDVQREKQAKQVARLQAVCRGFLARRRLKKLQEQNDAVRIIQSNFRSFMSLRKWPWWRIFIRILPLLEVKRNDEQSQKWANEIHSLRILINEEHNVQMVLKGEKKHLEAKIVELTSKLAEESILVSLTVREWEEKQNKWLKEKSALEDKISSLEITMNDLESTIEMLKLEALKNAEVKNDETIFRQKYEKTARELDSAKKRLQQQHEDDMEQLVAMKKQLEKKINESYEEVDDLRQNIAQWKKKFQMIQGELREVRQKYEEQISKNSLLEKRQRKIEGDLNSLQDDCKTDALLREKLQKENESLKSIKYNLDDKINVLQTEVDCKQEKIIELTKTLEELRSSGLLEEDILQIRRQKQELEAKLMEEANEIEGLNEQIQILEQTKDKLELSIAELTRVYKRDLAFKDEEFEESRAGFQKKIKTLEQQIETDHDEKLTFIREKHEFEAKIFVLQETLSRSIDEEQVLKMKKDLKKTKALLKDAQLMLDKSTSDSSNKVFIRQLKNQLEDAEFAKTAAVKAKQNVELELSDVQSQLDDILRRKSEMDDKIHRMNRERADLTSQLDDAEEELQEVLKKYKATVSQLSVDHLTIQEQNNRIVELEEEKSRLKEQNADYLLRIESLEEDSLLNIHQSRFELKIKELETRLELEQTTRSRMETQINRLKEAIEKMSEECESLRNKEALSQDESRKLQRQLRELREDNSTVQQKEMEAVAKKNELEKQLELVEAENILAKNDLKLSLKRVEDLQAAIHEELESEFDLLTSDTESEDYLYYGQVLPEKHILPRFEGSFQLLEESSA